MSKRKMLGNDIPFEWTIKRNNVAENLSNYSLEVFLKHISGRRYPIDALAVNGNVISGIFRGKDQNQYGMYSLQLVENGGSNAMYSIDHVNFINLVHHTFEEGGEDCSNLSTSTISIQTNITTPSNGIGIKSITSTNNSASGAKNDVTITLDNNVGFNFSVYNGQAPTITASKRGHYVDILANGSVIATLIEADIDNINSAINNANNAARQANMAVDSTTTAISQANSTMSNITSQFNAKKTEIDEAITRANTQAYNAMTSASAAAKVNAQLRGTKLVVTDNTGTSREVDCQGPKGNQGLPGSTPVITATKVNGVTIIYADKTKIATILDGAQGSSYNLTDADKQDIADRVLQSLQSQS